MFSFPRSRAISSFYALLRLSGFIVRQVTLITDFSNCFCRAFISKRYFPSEPLFQSASARGCTKTKQIP